MTGLVVEAIAVAVLERPAYLSIADFVADPDMMALARAVAERNELPLDRLRFLADEPDRDVASVALDELGPPVDKQPVLLVRGGPDPDPFVTTLARMVAGRPWVDEELGLTHLDELGGTAVLEFLDWFMPDSGATVLIRVVSWGAGAPPPAMAYRFTGQGPCDPWIDLHTALAGGWLAAGDEALLHATGAGREGWALIEVTSAGVGHGWPE